MTTINPISQVRFGSKPPVNGPKSDDKPEITPFDLSQELDEALEGPGATGLKAKAIEWAFKTLDALVTGKEKATEIAEKVASHPKVQETLADPRVQSALESANETKDSLVDQLNKGIEQLKEKSAIGASVTKEATKKGAVKAGEKVVDLKDSAVDLTETVLADPRVQTGIEQIKEKSAAGASKTKEATKKGAQKAGEKAVDLKDSAVDLTEIALADPRVQKGIEKTVETFDKVRSFFSKK